MDIRKLTLVIMLCKWQEYQEALAVVSSFEKEQRDIQRERRHLRYPLCQTRDDVLWREREKLNAQMYEIRDLSPEQLDRATKKLLDNIIESKQSKLLKLRKEFMAAKIKDKQIQRSSSDD